LRRVISLIHSFGVRVALIFLLGTLLANATLARAGGGQGSETPQSGPFTGMVSDSLCGARHVKHPELDSPRCTRECVRTGANYILIDGDTSYNLQGNFAQLAQFAGQRAKVSGSLQGSTIRVSSISEP
jgi:hypothetical protein